MRFSLVIHLSKIVDPSRAFEQMFDAWKLHFGLPVQFFSNSGPGQKVDRKFLKSRSKFGRLDDFISIKLKESRKRSACSMAASLTNPSRPFLGDHHFIRIDLAEAWFAARSPEDVTAAVVGFIVSANSIGRVRSAWFEHEDIDLNTPFSDVQGAISRAYGSWLGHIAYLNDAFLTAHGGPRQLERAGFEIHSAMPTGVIAGIPLDFEPSKEEAAWRLFEALERLGVFTRHNDPSLLTQKLYSLAEVGGFLGAYEATFGRNFAIWYSDGLRLRE